MSQFKDWQVQTGQSWPMQNMQVGYQELQGRYQAGQIGQIVPLGQLHQEDITRRLQDLAFLQANRMKNMTGSKPIVVCNGQSHEAKDMDEAQALAEKLAHQHAADAYILKPCRKVAPKRDVVTTELV